MKKFSIFLLVLLLLCTGCASKTTAPLLSSDDAARVDHAVMVPEWGSQPQGVYTAKACVNTADVRTIVQALQEVELGKENEPVYGGKTVLFLLYQEDTLVTRLYIIDGKWVCIDDTYYACTNTPDLEALYDRLSTQESNILLEKVQT